jgi:DNA-directed RNA polymerase subunit RPC12/RpoP
MNISGKSVEIKCRRCGKTSKAEDFVLDYVYKMAVCLSCIKERKNNDSKTLKQSFKESEAPHVEAPKPIHPPGWDAEDEYLEKLERQKQKAASGQSEPSPKPYQMGSVYKSQQTPAYNSPKPQTAPSFSSMQRESQEHASSPSKPMSAADFGMRSTSKPAEQPHASQDSKPTKPMGVADFGMRSSVKAEEGGNSHQKGSILGDRAEKANADPDKTKYKCKKCGYEFFYNREKNMPRGCPYCNTQVMHLV